MPPVVEASPSGPSNRPKRNTLAVVAASRQSAASSAQAGPVGGAQQLRITDSHPCQRDCGLQPKVTRHELP
jgi:hypothetical protein